MLQELLFACCLVVVRSLDDSRNIDQGKIDLQDQPPLKLLENNEDGQEQQLNLDKFFSTLNLLQNDIQQVSSQIGKMMNNILIQYDQEQANFLDTQLNINTTVSERQPNKTSQNKEIPNLIEISNMFIDQMNQLEKQIHNALQNTDLGDQQINNFLLCSRANLYQYGSYFVIFGIVYKCVSIKKILKYLLVD